MDEERLAALGPSPIYQALAELLAKRDLTDILTYLSKTALEPLFGTIIGPDGANPAVNILSIDQPYLLAPSIDYYTDTAFMEKYQSAMVDLVESVVGTNVNEMSLKESKRVGFTLLEKPEIEARVKDFMAMETMLAGLRVKE
jgi:predicted metalloendopeptidase